MGWQDVIESEIKRDEVMGIPLVAKDPRSFLTTLAFDAYELILGIQNLSRDLEGQIKDQPAMMRLTRDRLKAFRAANEEHRNLLGAMLSPLGYQSISFTEFNQYLSRKRG